MQDGILKGTGNSRYLKSIADFLTQYPTYEDMVAALVAGTLPIDLNGINTAGWSQVPTYLNKANLLSDTTETAIWGNTGNRTVDAALRQLRTIMTNNVTSSVKIEAKSYVGTGVVEATPNSLTFSIVPHMLIVTKGTSSNSAEFGLFILRVPWAMVIGINNTEFSSFYSVSLTEKTVTWYVNRNSVNGDARFQLNEANQTYNAFAIGI